MALVRWSVEHPRWVMALVGLATLGLLLAGSLPSLYPAAVPWLPGIRVDTDPENMLSERDAVRVFHHEMKEAFAMHDMVVLGVVNDVHPEGVFNPASLRRIYDLAVFSETLVWPDPKDPSRQAGVIAVDLIAPNTVDSIEPGGPGEVRFSWLMAEPPATDAEALAIRAKAQRIPFLNGTLVSEDGKALCLYLPLTSKDQSYKVYAKLRERIAGLEGDERYHITGLPVAEDTFGVEMFVQMAISAPLAMLIIFLLLWWFFRKLVLITAPMILAVVSVILTMGLLIVTGQTIHIMSSMIPIFIMPMAVLDSVHILSLFFDRYHASHDRRRTVLEVMDTLFMAMLYTSLTTIAGFASLATTPIPPVQVFGLFCALGVAMAWVLTMTFIPAFVVLLPERLLEDFGARAGSAGEEAHDSRLSRLLLATGRLTYRRARVILALAVVVLAVAVYGISRIQVNDNPVKWFTRSHPIRVADRVLNEHFGGTYMAHLVLATPAEARTARAAWDAFQGRLRAEAGPDAAKAVTALEAVAAGLLESSPSAEEFFAALNDRAGALADAAADDDLDAWDAVIEAIDREALRGETFKQPEVLAYMEGLQKHLLEQGRVGKVNSLADIVKTVHRELFEGAEERFAIPATPEAVGQCLITYQNSHRPQDLGHFVTPDHQTTSLWLQLRSGDNVDMAAVVEAVDETIAATPPPVPLRHDWFGLTYINVVWQEKMVWGMLGSFLGSFLVVFLMMTILFRSALWGILCMVPLTITIAFLYGALGLVGKDYDMPVAVLSALALGLAVDFAIHFLEHTRMMRERHGTWSAAAGPVFGEPARAIMRNVVVIAVGFLPLLAAPLVPYKTVGVFLAAIMAFSGIATLLILPALVTVFESRLFPAAAPGVRPGACVTCLISAVTVALTVVVNVYQVADLHWTTWMWVAAGIVLVMAGLCRFASRRAPCSLPGRGAAPGAPPVP
ncbi:MAG: MMPL family transporter [Lentisphaerae bacterium]|nr:MMPL family transporter [Lentisphaerota bacterium]